MKTFISFITLLLCLFCIGLYAQTTVQWTNLINLENTDNGLVYGIANPLIAPVIIGNVAERFR